MFNVNNEFPPPLYSIEYIYRFDTITIYMYPTALKHRIQPTFLSDSSSDMVLCLYIHYHALPELDKWVFVYLFIYQIYY